MAGGQQTFVAGNVLTAAQLNAYLMDQSLMRVTSGTRPTAAAQGGGLLEGMAVYETDNNAICVYDGTNWNQITTEVSRVTASETSTSTSYTNLATAGPAVTITTGTQALVYITAQSFSTSAYAAMSVAVSGASTAAASDAYWNLSNVVGNNLAMTRVALITGLTAGANTFTAKYRVSAGTGTWAYREIAAHGLL